MDLLYAGTIPIPNLNLGETHDIECETSCPLDANATVQWCIHLLTIKYEVRLCWNESGQLYISPAASLLRVENHPENRLENYLAVNYTTFKIIQVPILLRYSFLGCFVQSGSCSSIVYYSLGIGSE